MEQAVWEHAFWHHFNINGTYPALLRVIVVFLVNVNHHFPCIMRRFATVM